MAHERRGLSGEREIAVDASALGDRNLHNGCTGLEQLPVASTQLPVVRSDYGSEELATGYWVLATVLQLQPWPSVMLVRTPVLAVMIRL